MTDRSASGGTEPPTLADLFFYAPIGLLLDAQTVTPELAQRGRQNVAAARIIGRMAVEAGMRRLDEIVQSALAEPEPAATTTDARADDAPQAEADDAATLREAPAPAAPDPGPDADAAEPPPDTDAPDAIPGYDTLAASQIVKRLEGLSDDELEGVRRYEETHRARRSILAKIARLQAA